MGCFAMPGKSCKQRRQERRMHLQWDMTAEASASSASTSVEEGMPHAQHLSLPRENRRGNGAEDTASVCSTDTWQSFAELISEEIVVRNTFVHIDEPKEDVHRRRHSEPFAFRVKETTMLDCDAASVLSTEAPDSTPFADFCGEETRSISSASSSLGDDLDVDFQAEQFCLVIRNTFLDVQVPQVDFPRRRSITDLMSTLQDRAQSPSVE